MKKREKSHHSLHDVKKRWRTTPLGIRILIIYTSVLALFYLIFGLTIPTNIFFGIITFGAAARLLNLMFLAALITILSGFMLKKHWAGGAAAGFFLFEVLNLITSFAIRFNIMKHAFIVITSAAIVLLNTVIIWYLYEKREYFTDLRHFKSGKADRIFITSIIILSLMLILSTTTYAAALYSSTMKITDKMIYELGGMTKEQAMFYCSGYNEEERDVCYLVVATAYKGVQRSICDNIQNDFYRITCIQAVMT